MRSICLRVRMRRLTMAGAFSLIPMLGCGLGPGTLDYSYEMSGGYEVFRSSAHLIDITLERRIVVPAKIVEVAWDESFILAKQQLLKDRGDGYEYPIPNRYDYWILDVKGRSVLGAFTEEEFKAKRTKLGVDQNLVLKSVEDYR
jgi:hypothetical protein